MPALAAHPQSGRPAAKDVGPRALGLIELPAHGKPRLVPIAIMIDGTFYDASAYKAAPVPMALASETVYEGFKTGVSQGLFTVTAALHGQNTWMAEGRWQSHAEIQAANAKRHAAAVKTATADADRAPVLRRAAGSGSGQASNPGAGSAASGSVPSAPVPASGGGAPSPPAAPSSPAGAASSSEPEDPDRPLLRRGAPTRSAASTVASDSSPPARVPAAAQAGRDDFSSPPIADSFAAISDASGPEARPYAYAMKPEEEERFSRKMLSLASAGISARPQQAAGSNRTPAGAGSGSASGQRAHKTRPIASFHDIRLRVFDLSSSNEPTLILMANAEVAATANPRYSPPAKLMVTLVAREDIYGELHQALLNITDPSHLDVLPQMELIDAIDADGDGRGELLFRQVSDGSSSFALYRVIGNQLWPLFRGTSGE